MAWTISNAMMKAYENSRCSQELAAESSAVTCSDGVPSALSNTTPMPDQFYWPDKTTEHSRLSRFGMTCEPLTESHGEDLLTWFRGDFPARTLAQQEKVRGLRESAAVCGVNLQGSLARYDHATHSLKTAQCSLIEDLTGCYATLPRWGSMRNGALFLRKIPVLHTAEKESGLSQNRKWPTPNCDGFRSDGELLILSKAASTHAEYIAMSDRACQSKRQRFWPTATATATAYKGWSQGHNRADTNDRLDYAVEREAFNDGQKTPLMRLNPDWVEWLMGWPIELTALKPLATGKFQEWLRQHGES